MSEFGQLRFDSPRTGTLPSGPRDAISDVGSVTVGHCTLADGAIQTGVSSILPHADDPFLHKVPAGVAVLNGFGKSVGLLQVKELGVLETPIALTNTFSVGRVAQEQIRVAVAAHPSIGRSWPTCNPLVFECNDGHLNDIQALAVDGNHYRRCLADARADFAQGSVGAGRGMSCFQLKGGIGSASRQAGDAMVGALVLANFGRLPQLQVGGVPVGAKLAQRADTCPGARDQGSIIIILATDAALDARQLRRLATRCGAGLARTGSTWGHGSGDIALAFSTAYTLPADPRARMPTVAMLHETCLDPLFDAAVEATEQAIVHALWAARGVTGRNGHSRPAVAELLPQWRALLAFPSAS